MAIVLTKREEELMNFLWEYGKPLAANQILELCKERTWSDRYLQGMLSSLEKKGAIESCGVVRQGNHYSRQFRCCFSREDYFVQLAQASGVDTKLFAKAAVALAAGASQKDQSEVIRELEQLLDDYKKKG